MRPAWREAAITSSRHVYISAVDTITRLLRHEVLLQSFDSHEHSSAVCICDLALLHSTKRAICMSSLATADTCTALLMLSLNLLAIAHVVMTAYNSKDV
jgi:hypothetical protein